MKKINLVGYSFAHALATAIYCSGVALVMYNAKYIFREPHSFVGPLAFLLLFIASALITGSLILLRPIHMYMSGAKDSAIRLLFYTLGWILLFMIIAMFLIRK